MPIYEYDCIACGRSFEHFHRRVTNPEPASCPHCGSSDVRRRLSLFAAHHSAPADTTPPPCLRCGNPAGSCAWENP